MRASIENINILSIIRQLGLLLVILIMSTIFANAQKDDNPPKMIKSRLSFECIQKSGVSLDLVVKLRYKEGRVWTPIQDEKISFFHQTDTLEHLLGEIKTDDSGIAIFSIPNDKMINSDTSGMLNFKATYSGSDKFKSSKRTKGIKEAVIELEAIEIDSVKSLRVTVYEKLSNGDKMFVSETDVFVYAKRLYSELKILELYTDDDGIAFEAFPIDLPGNQDGVVSITAKIEDSDDYGTVVNSMDINWGIPVSNQLSHAERSLWAVEAPIWMVVTFWILMSGVWFHYYWIMYMMFKKNKDYIEIENS